MDASVAVLGLLFAFGLVFVVSTFVAPELPGRLALLPVELLDSLEILKGEPATAGAWASVLTVFTSAFVHSGIAHLVLNGLYLWFFGGLLAKLAGDRWVLVAFFFCCISSGAAFVIAHADDVGAGVVGASGAISGVAGLYVLLSFRWDMPNVQVWPLARPVPPIQAALVAILVAGADVYALNSGEASGIARASHLGGFAGGLLVGMVLTTLFDSWIDFRRSRAAPRSLRSER